MVDLHDIYDKGLTWVRLDNNEMLTDWTCVANVADPRVLISDQSSPIDNLPMAVELFIITENKYRLFRHFPNNIGDRPRTILPAKRVTKKLRVISRSLDIAVDAMLEFACLRLVPETHVHMFQRHLQLYALVA
jgi:hypothetical protein